MVGLCKMSLSQLNKCNMYKQDSNYIKIEQKRRLNMFNKQYYLQAERHHLKVMGLIREPRSHDDEIAGFQ